MSVELQAGSSLESGTLAAPEEQTAGKEAASHDKFASRHRPLTSVFPSGMLPWVEHIHARQTKHPYLLILPVISGSLCSARQRPRSPMQKAEFPASAELKNYTQLPQTE